MALRPPGAAQTPKTDPKNSGQTAFRYPANESSKTYPYPRVLAGPEIVDFGGLNGPVLPQNPLEKVGGLAPHLFQWVLR